MVAKIPALIPTNLSLPPSSAATFSDTGIDFSYGIGGMGWLSAANPERPIRRETAQYRKQQLDIAGQAGEQSLENWWYRSQLSFHGGAGQLYNDPNTRGGNTTPGPETIETRYWKSCGLDPWTVGSVSMLPAVTKVASPTVVSVLGYVSPTSKNMVMWVTATNVSQRSADGTYSGTTPAPAADPILAACTDGSNVYVATVVGIYKGALPDGDGTVAWVKIWNTGSSKLRIAWAKSRLIACIGTAVYQLTGTGPTLPATPNYTHPNASWIWSSISVGGRAIYISGYAGGRSSIFKFALSESSGDMPQLSTGIMTAEMPEGEAIYTIYGYLATFMAIGTSRGVRIGVADDQGDITYGPLIVETTYPVQCFTAWDRFIYFGLTAGIDGHSGLGRIDVGYAIDGLRFAYAWDVFDPVAITRVTGCAMIGNTGNVAFGTFSDGFFLVDGSGTKVPSGYLITSRVRYSTLEPKLFKLLRVRAPLLSGSLGVSIAGPSGVDSPLITLPPGQIPMVDLDIKAPAGPQEYVAIRFAFNRSVTDLTKGAELTAYQLKALPGSTRNRLISVPVLCFDLEEDGNGMRWGEEGAALGRLLQIESIEATGDTVLFQDFANNTATVVTIEKLEFMQTAPPINAEGWGGYLNISMRTMT